MNAETAPVKPRRIESIDQFRGYTIFGMILVNYCGQFPCMPEWTRHHSDYITYADTIAPIFLFVAGMGFRRSFLHQQAKDGPWKAAGAGLRRYLVLTLIGILYYAPLDWLEWWDALVDIGFAGMLSLPFIGASTRIRVGAAAGYLAVYQLLLSRTGYGAWVMGSFDGGPLGPLSWVFCFLLGSVLNDLIEADNRRNILLGCLAWGIALCLLGWGFHVEWPGVKSTWPFSQTTMAVPYPVLATGIAFLCYLPFFVLSDVCRIQIPTFTAIGMNPLVIYLLHGAYLDIHKTIIPEDSGILPALLVFAVFYGACYIVARYLQKNKMFVKI